MNTHKEQLTGWNLWVKSAEENRFGVIAIALLIVGCLGGVTMQQGAVANTGALVAVVIPTMLTLSLLLAVAPMKYILSSIIVSVLVDVLVMVLI